MSGSLVNGSAHGLGSRRRPGSRRQSQARQGQGTERIDGIVALIMAIGRALVAQEEPQPMYQVFWV
jgi:phage terminase large subunit-like protein